MAARSRVLRRPHLPGHTVLPLAGWAALDADDALSAPTDATGAAFFDVDNTMMQGASIYYFARGLAARKYFSTGDLMRFALRQLRFRLVAAEHAGHVSSSKAAALAFVAGWRVEDMDRLAEEIFDELMAERIWAGSRALAQMHLDSGQRVWLVTAAPIHDGVYTGNLVGDLLHGPAKADAVRALAAAEGLDLARCAAYSDSVNDTPMLSLVGRAVAVNPDSALLREARRRGWEVCDFRTGRKAAKIAVPATVGAGLLAGAIAAGVAAKRRRV
jgi:phosphoserine phosphatase